MPIKTKKHPDFPNYLFYSDGRIQNIQLYFHHTLARKKVINPRYNKFLKFRKHPQWDLYMVNPIDKDGIQRTVFPHKMTASLFVRNPKKKNHVWFRDDDKNNIRWTNLFWVTQGDLNHIQERLGTRDMAKQAAVMRKSRRTVGRGNKSNKNK